MSSLGRPSTSPRRPRPRTRTFRGCLTCRARKVKCGEERPVCNNCTRVGVTCRGYETTLQWRSTDHSTYQTSGLILRSETHLNEKQGDRPSRRVLFSDSDRNAMTLQMTHPFSRDNLDDDINQAIDVLEQHFPESAISEGLSETHVIGPFGVFHLQSEQSADSMLSPCSEMLQSSESPALATRSYSTTLTGGLHDQSPISSLEWPESGSISGQRSSQHILEDAASDYSGSPPFASSHTINATSQSEAPRPSMSWPILDVQVQPDVRFLLNHYITHVIHLLLPMPQTESPWKCMFLSSSLNAFGELSIVGTTNFSKASLFYGILALSAFHADAVYGRKFPSGTRMGELTLLGLREHPAEQRSNWYNLGTKYSDVSRMELERCLHISAEDDFQKGTCVERLMALITLIMIGIVNGNVRNTRLYLNICDFLMQTDGFKSHGNTEELLNLNCIVAYFRTIEATTFTLSPKSYIRLLRSSPSHTSNPCPDLLLKEYTNINQSSPQPVNFEHADHLCKLYGLPLTLLNLISRTAALSNAMDTFRSQNPDLAIPDHFSSQARDLENVILTPLSDALSIHSSPSEKIAHHITRSTHSALIVYFLARIRHTNPLLLQPYILTTLVHLRAHQDIKDIDEIDSGAGILLWCAFVVACEALGELRKTALESVRNVHAAGFENASIVEAIIREFWMKKSEEGWRGAEEGWWGLLKETRELIVLI